MRHQACFLLSSKSALAFTVGLLACVPSVQAQAQSAPPQLPSPAVDLTISAQGPATAAAIQSALQSIPLDSPIHIALTKLYASVGYQPLFVNGTTLTVLAMDLRQSLAKIQEHGLPLGDYWSMKQEMIYAQSTATATATLITSGVAAELTLAETYVAAAVHINIGRMSPAQVSSHDKIKARSFTAFDLLKSGVLGSGIGATWDTLAPKADGYQKLKLALAQLRASQSQSQFPRATSARQAMDVQMNMEKYRWLPNDPGLRYLTVNTAMQILRVTDPSNSNPKIAEMRIINGQSTKQTPSMVDNFYSLELNPPWHVTTNIFAREKYPEIRAVAAQASATGNPALIQHWFDSHNFMLISSNGAAPVDPVSIDWLNYVPTSGAVILTERPGYNSSLGVIKFNLQHPPGAYYLHDTDTRAAFAQSFRLLSHGCIRVQNPVDLAEYLLAGSGWDRARIEASLLKEGQVGSTSIPLAIPKQNRIPVYVLNLTADVGLDGVLRFARDTYGDTAALEKALFAAGYYHQRAEAGLAPGQALAQQR